MRDDLFPRWTEIILDVLSSARLRCVLGADKPRRWFELLGFDIMIDEFFRSWLIEANTNPSIDFHCKYADALFARLLEEMAQLTIDRHFPPAMAPEPLPPHVYEKYAVLPWDHDVIKEARPDWMAMRPAVSSAGTLGVRVASSPAASEASPVSSSTVSLVRAPPRASAWTLVWSETVKDLASIPHQAAMHDHATNREAVEELLALEGSRNITSDDVAALATKHGLMPLLSTLSDVTPCLEHDEMLPPGFERHCLQHRVVESAWKPVLRRYIRRHDESWLYPLGRPDSAASSVVTMTTPCSSSVSASVCSL